MTSVPRAAAAAGGQPAIDLAHLDRQTMGDPALRGEVLALMRDQIDDIAPRLELSWGADRAALAHKLKGAARGVGAFALAAAAGLVEAEPDVEPHLAALQERMREAAEAIASLAQRHG